MEGGYIGRRVSQSPPSDGQLLYKWQTVVVVLSSRYGVGQKHKQTKKKATATPDLSRSSLSLSLPSFLYFFFFPFYHHRQQKLKGLNNNTNICSTIVYREGVMQTVHAWANHCLLRLLPNAGLNSCRAWWCAVTYRSSPNHPLIVEKKKLYEICLTKARKNTTNSYKKKIN